jgi:hypothetical protein
VTVAVRRAPVPRAALLTVAIAAVSHLIAAVNGLGSVHTIPAWHWGLLLCGDACLALVVLRRGEWFLTRNFRLPGIFVVTTSIIILAPLPVAVRRYGAAVPYQTVLSIAGGLAMFSLVVYISTAKPPVARRSVMGRSDSLVPWAIVGISVVLLPVWLRTIGSVPLVELFGRTDVLTAAIERDRALDSLSNGALRAAVGGIRNLYLMFASGYLVSCAFTRGWFDWRSVSRRRLAAAGVVGLAAVYALLTTERAILGELVIVAVVAALVTRRRQLTVRHIAVTTVVGGSFPIMYAILVKAGGFAVAVKGLTRRIFYLPDDVMLHYFVAFPRAHPFLHGSSVPKWGRLTGAPTFDISGFIYDKYYKVDPSLKGIANGSFFGVGWANWGLLGVFAWCAVVALAIVATERILQVFSTPSAAALRGVAVVQTALLTSADVTRSLLGFLPGFVDIPLVIWAVASIDRRFSTKRATLKVPISSGRQRSTTRSA